MPRTRPRRPGTPVNTLSEANDPPAAHQSGHEPIEVLRAENLTVSFPGRAGEIAIVDRVSLGVRAGEVLGLVGESGCGKTMTALALAGLVPPPGAISADEVRIKGEDVSKWPEQRRATLRGGTVGLVGQDPMVALDPCFTVRSTLVEALRAHRHISRRAAKSETLELLRKVGIPRAEDVARRYPHQLSGGMAQRVAIALALTGNPDILIADEPTTALDVTVQAEILDLLRQVRDKLGTAVILVTHDLGVVADFCDRVAVMYAGQVIESGPVEIVLTSPSHPYTQGLLGASPGIGASGDALRTIPGRVPVPADWPKGCRFADRCPIAVSDCRSTSIPLTDAGPARASRCIRVDVAAPGGLLERVS